MEHVRWLSEPTLRTPTLISAFTGWNDAGDAASSALRAFVEEWGATAVAEIDPEPFTDFATVRPHVRLDDGRRKIVWPTVGVWSASTPGGDVLLVLGPEPALRWKLFCRQFTALADQLAVALSINLGALLADVPHTRSVQVIGTATDRELIERFGLQQSRYEGPTGIVGVLSDALSRAGVSSVSLWAAVPGYAAQVPSPRAALALVRRAAAIIGTPAPDGELGGALTEYDARVAALIADNDDLVDYVTRLEGVVDDSGDSDDPDGAGGEATPIEHNLPSAADVDPGQLVAEVERFLRDRDPGT
ncbi:MAG: PAC2 family protein [Actinomycetota bacterium]|nr:PAC2 family protein [Acidimicrobiia bacterium]MDQ3470617.1 PAC2 family protein [Actinomycetota bacterium]